jgi:drug/metabolite transporter (DMT)-like permease
MVSTIQSPSRVSGLQLVCGLVAVAAAHVACTFVLYRALVVSDSAVDSSDLLLYALPVIFTFLAYFFLLRARAARMIPPWVGAFLLTFVSFCLSLLLAFNTFGI